MDNTKNMLLGIMFVIFGLLMMSPSFIKGLLQFRNTLSGSKSNITKETTGFYKILGISFIGLGLIFIVGFFKV